MHHRLTRPHAGASLEERRVFGRRLLAALDEIGVQPGCEFFVTRTAETAHARSTDPETSRSAAASVGDLRDSQAAVLKVFESHARPMTDDALVRRYHDAERLGKVPQQSESGIRSRRSELERGGLLVDTGEKEALASGRMAILWGLPQQKNGIAEPKLFDAPEEPRKRASFYDPD